MGTPIFALDDIVRKGAGPERIVRAILSGEGGEIVYIVTAPEDANEVPYVNADLEREVDLSAVE